MATIVFFHAHPDDEAIATGGTMARLSDEGHRVVLVTATGGELGEVADGFLDPGETLAERRAREVEAAARILGAARGEFLGYHDSGMIDTPANEAPESFWQAPTEEAAERLATILREESADVLTCYDHHGNYGHPDHIKVHQVGVRAAELAGTRRVYEATVDRDAIVEMMRQQSGPGDGPESPVDIGELGMPGHLITTRVDVTKWIDRKKQAMRAHASQIAETSFFLAMPDDMFEMVWGTESYIRRGAPAGTAETTLVDGL
ncbi:MAG TPA: PIG-L family deacetylase [Acidimicrobiales bacterium]|nr:PIG-L family deacetylase [Acidimicrobiales bacterium]